MGLLQQAVKTYDSMKKMGMVGKYEEGKEPLAPIGHLLTTANIMITVDKTGKFISAEKIERKIIIPVTEESAGRTSAPVAHPLDDNIGYLSGDDEKKKSLYLDGINKWNESKYGDNKLHAIIMYLETGNLKHDLEKEGLLKFDSKGNISNEKDTICWNVIGLDKQSGPVFEDIDLMKKYTSFYVEERKKLANVNNEICFVSGNMDITANQHLKGVVSINGNAKIISANDSTNYTYRGRFVNPEEALSVGYISSQKAHNALKWLVSNQKAYGNRVFICWNPNGKEIPMVQSPLLNLDQKIVVFSDYKKELDKMLKGYMSELSDMEDVIITSFDAATTGRLSIAYYNELRESDFLERLRIWDESCCWNNYKYGIYSPRLYDIILYAFGNQRGNEENSKIDVDDKIISQYMQRLISCRVDRVKIPRDIVNSLINKASNLQTYNKINRNKLLFTACAVIRKYHYDYTKEEWEMALEPEKKDRSYQYGRLLAVLEKIEKDTYDNGENRETNAIRMQSVFVKRPAYATKIILEQLKNSYYPKLNVGARVYFDKMIGQIMEMISEFGDEDYKKPLNETYLLGYYLQKNYMYSKKENNEKEDKDNE